MTQTLEENAASCMLSAAALAVAASLARGDADGNPSLVRVALSGPASLVRPVYGALRVMMPENPVAGTTPHTALEELEGGLARVTAWVEVE